jgi:hypothetical protein
MKHIFLAIAVGLVFFSCKKNDTDPGTGGVIIPESVEFQALSSLLIAADPANPAGAAEISAYDSITKRLFVVSNNLATGLNGIEVVDLSKPSAPARVAFILIGLYGGLVNSVDVSNGLLAAAIESANKVNDGSVVVFKTTDYSVVKQIPVGALPDMVTFSPDGKYILTANEGEPNDAYTIDPVGSVSIISISEAYKETRLNFEKFASSAEALKQKGLRIFGKGASFAQDIEPEYITVSSDSKMAWVSLQENNAIARINLVTNNIEEILPLGFKDYGSAVNAMDLSDRPANSIVFKERAKVFGMYQPDGITLVPFGSSPMVITANEGDAREYTGFSEMLRVSASGITLDPVAFPAPAFWSNTKNYWKEDTILGRLNVTTTLGKEGDVYKQLYSLGGRSFSIWNGMTGQQMFDSKNELDTRARDLGIYPDGRSDDKGVEPESVATAIIGTRYLLFVGMERSNSVFVYELKSGGTPVFLQYLQTGTAPEGLLVIPAVKSPIQKTLLVVSSETSGDIQIFVTK